MVTIVQVIFTLFMYLIGIIVMGVAVFPGVMMVVHVISSTAGWGLSLRVFVCCLAGVSAYFIYGFCLIWVVALLRIVFGLTLKEGEYRVPSWQAAKWAFTNALVLVVSVTFMDFMLLTPLAALFYRLMGAKLGRNVQINSKNCADLSLLEIGDNALIGGHATVIGHSFERGRLILKKVVIGPNVVVGLNSVVLPGSVLGKKSMLAAGAVLAKNASMGEREIYFGVPARSVKERHEEHKD